MQRWFVYINTNFETWMWKQFIVWGMGTLWKHWQVVYQFIVPYHENFGKKYLWFLQVLQFVETIFQNTCYQEPFMSFNEARNFECFDMKSACDIKVEKMDSKVVFEMWHNMILFFNSIFGLNLRKNSFIFVNLICFGRHICVWELKILSTCHWKCIC
jgi:hypothetical protein